MLSPAHKNLHVKHTDLSYLFHDYCKDPEIEDHFTYTKAANGLGRVKPREVHRDDVSIQQDERYVGHLQMYHQMKG